MMRIYDKKIGWRDATWADWPKTLPMDKIIPLAILVFLLLIMVWAWVHESRSLADNLCTISQFYSQCDVEKELVHLTPTELKKLHNRFLLRFIDTIDPKDNEAEQVIRKAIKARTAKYENAVTEYQKPTPINKK